MTQAKLIDGKAIANDLKTNIRAIIKEKSEVSGKTPGLAVILIGNDVASQIYVRNKHDACKEVGIRSINYQLPTHTGEEELVNLIQHLNQDETIDGILIQLPLPSHLDAQKILECISPHKDVDGFHAYNLGRLAQRRPLLRPCTPQGIMLMLDHIGQLYKGKHAVVVGASNIVGRPMALELLIAGATVTICHRFTTDIAYFVKQADIVVAAVGKPNLIKGEWIKEGATLIDVGINRVGEGTIVGDIEFNPAKERAAWITPVPGGVGPMTVAVLLYNTLIAAKWVAN